MSEQSLVKVKTKAGPTTPMINMGELSNVTKSKLLWKADIFLQSNFIF